MTPTEEQEAMRKAREAKVREAWQALSQDANFQAVFELDLQVHFNLHRPSFQSSDGYNASAAALRDGQKTVISHIARKIATGIASLEQDEAEPTKSTEAL